MLCGAEWGAQTLVRTSRRSEIDDKHVCAVVVTYYPDEDVVKNLVALRPEVREIVVVDNGSPDRAVGVLRSSISSLRFKLIENDHNLGIAAALNQGIRWALDQGYKWVALFDQDSTVVSGYIKAMLNVSYLTSEGSEAAILVPKYIDSRLGHTLDPLYTTGGNIALAMTSGSFMQTSVFEENGWFAENLFIGGVDYEYSLRLRSCGKILRECPGAILLHSPSRPRPFTLFGTTLFYTSNYGPLRRYYSERSHVWLLRKYGRRFPAAIYGLYMGSAKECIKILLGENNKCEKVSYMIQGVLDGVIGRMGKKLAAERVV
jgi:rhamnosyltransferase